MMNVRIVWNVCVALLLLPSLAWALSSEERSFFGLTALESSHPWLTGEGFSFAVNDTEFDLTHPALGWDHPETYTQWYNSTNPIPNLPLKNTRLRSSGNNTYATRTSSKPHHGAFFFTYDIPVDNNNTLKENIWSQHGTSVAGTAGGGTNGPLGRTLGVVPKAGMILASDTATFNYSLGQILDGNPTRTVAANRSFTGSSTISAVARNRSGLITVNAAGNSFDDNGLNRLVTGGRSPQFSSIRWLPTIGYDLIASGLSGVTFDKAFVTSYGSQRNQESIFTDYSISTIRPNGIMDAGASGTSFSSPFTVGGTTLIQHAYVNAHPDRWLREDQVGRIIKRTARFVDDDSTGLRYPVADFEAAVLLAESYEGDPGYEPNFSTDFSDTNRVNNAFNPDPVGINPKQFRASFRYDTNATKFLAPRIVNDIMEVYGNDVDGGVNIAIRNGWGDLGLVDLTHPGKKITMAFDYDTNPGFVSGSTETYIGFKEMIGSDQFMDSSRLDDAESIGRVAFRITANQGSDNSTLEALRCSTLPNTNSLLWTRWSTFSVPVWDFPISSVTVTNLTLGQFPQLQAEFTKTHMRLLRDGVELMNVPHGAPAFALPRATPYLHIQHSQTDHWTRVDNFSIATTTAADPVVNLFPRRDVALEGLEGQSPVAHGLVSVSRSIQTNTALTINYLVAGTATNGSDYKLLPGTFTIPAGVAETDIIIKAITDDTIESSETVLFQLLPGPGYTLGMLQVAAITILDYSDADGDGLMNTNEDRNANGFFMDEDNDYDMLPDYADDDDDNDSIPTLDEDLNLNGDPRDDDSNTNGVPNYLDNDDDGDGILTVDEDANKNGDPTDDDYDTDGRPDYLDLDPVPISIYGSMDVMGTFNGWIFGSTPMTLIGSGLWEAQQRSMAAPRPSNLPQMVGGPTIGETTPKRTPPCPFWTPLMPGVEILP